MEKNIKISEKAKKLCHKRIILDSSVLIKAVIDEENSYFVQELLLLAEQRKLALLSTPLILFEFLNVLSKGLKDEERVKKILKKFFKSHIGLIPQRYDYIEKGIKAACENQKVSYYDSSYHALAKQMNGIFLTADEKYYEIMKDEGNIMLLSEVAG